MKLTKSHILSAAIHILTVAVIICAAVCPGGSYSVQAATYDIISDVAAPRLEAEKSENLIIISWVAADDTDLDGFSGKLTYDKDTFSYNEDDLVLTGLSASVDPGSDIIVAIEQNPQKTVYKSGESIFTLNFHLKDGAQITQSKDYAFSFTLNKDAYTYDMADYSWCGDTFTLTYREEADGTVAVESEVIPDPDPVTDHTADEASSKNSGTGNRQTQVTAGTENTDSGTPSVSGNTGSSSNNARTTDNKPATGDRNNMLLWIGIAVGAVTILCVAAVFIIKHRRKE